MPIYDQSTTILTTPTALQAAIKFSLTLSDQFIVVRPDMLFIVLSQEIASVYLLRTENDGTVRLRLIVDSAANVRSAFRGKQPPDALRALLASPASLDEKTAQMLSEIASRYLESLKQAVEQPGSVRPPAPIALPEVNTDDYQEFDPEEAYNETGESEASPPPRGEPTFSANTGQAGSDPNIAAIFARKPLGAMEGDSAQTVMLDNPWNPARLMGWGVIFTPIAGIAMGINWRRLGKPEWMWLTIFASIFIPVAVVLFSIILFRQALRSPFIIPSVMILVGINWGYLYALYFLQRGAYKTWDRTGSVRDLLTYKYNFTGAIAVAVGIIFAVAVLGGVLSYRNSQPNTFDSPDVSITYPNTWAKHDFSNLPACSQPSTQCIMFVSDAQFGYTSILLVRAATPMSISPEDAEQGSWSTVLQSYPSASLDSRGPTVIAGVPGYRHYYYVPNQQNAGNSDYGMQIFFMKGQTLYQLTAESLSYGIFQQHQNDIDQFIEGITLK